MRIHIASDHAGLEFKGVIIEHLKNQGHDVVDHGPDTLDPQDDYPVFCIPAAQAVAHEPGSLGIVLGGSGNGEQIAANKVKGIRAALVWNEATAIAAREHNDANIMAIGGRMHKEGEAIALVDLFLKTPFTNHARHIRRIKLISDFESNR
jgi:ribose 5-phosphate isomerase B